MSGNETDVQMVGRTRSSVPDRMPEAPMSLHGHAPELSSRALADGRTGTLDARTVVHLQALAGNASVSRLIEDEQAPDKVRSAIGDGGERMDSQTAQSMSARFGEDFSDVRIHQDGAAAASARAVNAHAYTVGSDVVFDAGQYDPSSDAGQRTLAHELTHVVQQRNGAVSGSDIGGGLAVSDPADRYERAAAANADRVMSSAAPSAAGMSAQRHSDDDEHAPAPVAQREELPEDEERNRLGHDRPARGRSRRKESLRADVPMDPR